MPAAGTPLLEAELEAGQHDFSPSAPPEDMYPSAPPEVLSPTEFQQLLTSLPQGSADLPTEQALRQFRTATAGKVVWTEQMREIASSAAGGGLFMREAYERQLILDPEILTTSDAPWAECLPSAPPDLPELGAAQAAQALLSQLMVLRFDGKVANVSVKASQSWLDIGHAAASRFGDLVFDPASHVLLGVGQAPEHGLRVGQTVKLTAVVNRPELNGKVGRITRVNGEELDVALPRGLERLHQDNVMPHNVSVVSRSASFPLDFAAPADTSTVLRVLWLERAPQNSQSSPKSRASTVGPLRAIGWQYVGMSARKHNLVSLGEFRNFLWNLHLEDSNFAVVSKRFAPTGNYIDYEEVLFLLGRSHLRCKEVPIDALIYEAVVSILGRRCTAHIDRDLGAEDAGLGKRNACREHCASYTTSFILEAVIWLTLLFVLFSFFIDETSGIKLDPTMLAPAGIAYLIYICHLACCVRLTRAFANETEGIESVMLVMDKPRHENPYYRWRVQCYHYRTETRTRRDKDGKVHTYTQRVRVNTHSAYASGHIPSQDLTSEFVPNTAATQTQIDTKVDLDFSSSNYYSEYNRWRHFHRRDLYQDSSHAEELASRVTSCLAVWSQRNMPCWLNSGCYWLANLFALSFLYRLLAQSRIGKQEYVYAKKCFNIRRGW